MTESPDHDAAEVFIERMRGFGTRLLAAREKRGWTQQQLAEALGVSTQAVSQWETGKTFPRSPTRIRTIASALNVRWTYLVGYAESPEDQNRLDTSMVPVLRISDAYSALVSPTHDVKFLVADTGLTLFPTYKPRDVSVALEIDDDSMAPIFQPGDHAIFDYGVFPLPGDIAVVAIHEKQKIMVRRFRLRSESGQEVQDFYPLNEDYPVETVPSAQHGDVKGTVVEHRRYRKRR